MLGGSGLGKAASLLTWELSASPKPQPQRARFLRVDFKELCGGREVGAGLCCGARKVLCWLCVIKYSNALEVGWAAGLAAGESPSREAVLKLRPVWSSSSKSPILSNWLALGTHGAVWVVECCGSEASLPSGGTPLSEQNEGVRGFEGRCSFCCHRTHHSPESNPAVEERSFLKLGPRL